MMNDKMEYHIDRKVWQILWDAIMTPKGFGWGDSDFSNDVFEFRAYRWDDETNDYHFHHKPSGFKIEWYKYPLRGAMCNIEITDSQFVDILNDCINSLQTNEKVRIFYEVDDWWLPKEERKYAFSRYE